MNTLSKSLLAAASLAMLSVGAASSQTTPAHDGEYKGVMVCAQLPGQAAVVRAPLDMTVTDKVITFARPIFGNNQVVGSEVAKGALEGDAFTMTSTGSDRASHYEAKYSGAITADGGTFTGTQSWTMADVTRTRTCTGAVVKSRS